MNKHADLLNNKVRCVKVIELQYVNVLNSVARAETLAVKCMSSYRYNRNRFKLLI